MKYLITISIVLYAFFNVNANDDFISANQLLQNQKTDAAIEAYQKLIEEGFVGAPIYENLGTAHLQVGNIVAARKFLEQARLSEPKNQQVSSKIRHIRKQLEYKSERMPVIFYKQWWLNVMQLFGVKGWTVLFLFFVWCLGAVLILQYKTKQQPLLFVRLACSILAFISFWALLSQYNAIQQQNIAIVNKECEVREGATLQSNFDYTLSAGAKTKVTDKNDVWLEIKLEDGRSGWVLAQDLDQL